MCIIREKGKTWSVGKVAYIFFHLNVKMHGVADRKSSTSKLLDSVLLTLRKANLFVADLSLHDESHFL